MHYGAIKYPDIANGPGIRVSLFVSGCNHNCPECFNQEAQSFAYGDIFDSTTMWELDEMLKNPNIQGLSILGGEPLDPANRTMVLHICATAKSWNPKKDIWMWTGYLWEQVKDLPVFKYVDVLVDGPFMKDLKNLSLAYRGSSNQRIIDVKESLKTGEPVLWLNDYEIIKRP